MYLNYLQYINFGNGVEEKINSYKRSFRATVQV